MLCLCSCLLVHSFAVCPAAGTSAWSFGTARGRCGPSYNNNNNNNVIISIIIISIIIIYIGGIC